MSFRIYHQCGHNAIWNINSYEDSGTGSGCIFSPVHEPLHRIEQYNSGLKQSSFFDPQFYLPGSQKRKLQTYDFFPEVISEGFSTQIFHAVAMESAQRCVDFQLSQGFDRIIIPARFHEQMVSGFTARQEQYTVLPFLDILNDLDCGVPIYLTLPLTSHMIEDDGFRETILNWVTSFPEIDGVYLVVESNRNTKQITDERVLRGNLKFIHELKNADLEVLMAYCNSESILYSIVGDLEVTFGAYENTRMFSLDKFLDSSGDRRGPRARIYLEGLCNWVQLEQARDIKKALPDVWNEVYVETEDSEEALNSPMARWPFNRKNLYLHHFERMDQVVRTLSPMNQIDRHEWLRAHLLQARDYFQEIENNFIDLEVHGNGNHIAPWLNVINEYRRDYLS